ncbi:hypothetical protein Taro_022830 [Colocasia esculenta]|uniref:WLM domain-containing protein n=1 Tax=Colocasia esculenta TaxID=4460 RepID=A0A843VFK8_COLES|nr:hypothetical protein [Colocasia esculenta]
MDLGDLNKVWEVRPLQKPGEDAARRTLEAVAEQVQPIMRKHHWKVQILSEFCPENPSLMGLNEGGGAHVKLRLRRPGRDLEFLTYEQVLDTMLHELCHIEHGPHNADFYKLWDEVREECEDLIAKGIKGSAKGFDLPGRRLGGFTRYPSPPPLRDAARDAAERRVRGGPLVPSGPRRVGGDGGIRAVLSPIQAAAMAAERRMRDDLWCASRASNFGESSEMPDGHLGEVSNVRRQSSNDVGLPSVGSHPSSYKDGTLTSTSASDELSWECRACTLLNQDLNELSCSLKIIIEHHIKQKGVPSVKSTSEQWNDSFFQESRC